MNSNIFYNIDNRSVLGELFRAAFGVAPIYITVPIGEQKPTEISGFQINLKNEPVYEDDPRTSIYGTPVIFPVKFEAGTYQKYDDNGKIYKENMPDLWLPATSMADFSRAKNIIKTNTLGSNGTVKEIYSFDDWQIRIRILCLNEKKVSAHEQADKILSFAEVAESVEVLGSLFTKKEIHRIAIESIDIKSITGQPDVVPIEITATSDEAIELVSTEKNEKQA